MSKNMSGIGRIFILCILLNVIICCFQKIMFEVNTISVELFMYILELVVLASRH